MNSEFIAHVREKDGAIQTVQSHLHEVGELCSLFAEAVGLPLCGKLIGLLHDLGKYSSEFQGYIQDATGMNGKVAQVAAEAKQGKIDHATAGAQYLWLKLSERGPKAVLLAQILSVAIMSHHSRKGMVDFIDLEGESPFFKRLSKSENLSFMKESFAAADQSIQVEIQALFTSSKLLGEFDIFYDRIVSSTSEPLQKRFAFGMLSRFLFSCLLDADRLSTADFENPVSADFRSRNKLPHWVNLTKKLESKLDKFNVDSKINQIRREISKQCKEAAGRPNRLFSLQVPTGGGKTLASLRFALNRASHLDSELCRRIIIVLPYTTIIEQNASEVAEILGHSKVLEHHSNLTPENDKWRNKVLSENWDAPVVFTTSVQFLNALFAKGTNTARRMHQLAESIVIFDEIQSLPIKTIHIFNNAIRFLTQFTGATVVLSTATMPTLDQVGEKLGQLEFSEGHQIIQDPEALSLDLKRTEIVSKIRETPWTRDEVSKFALECMDGFRSVLIVCNTKKAAENLFFQLKGVSDEGVKLIHLSTNMCPSHRKKCIAELRGALEPASMDSVICVSTPLIEAGVDLDFGCVIRSHAGLDSVVQAGGRCNRHQKRENGHVYIINMEDDKLSAALREIQIGQSVLMRVLSDFSQSPEALGHDLLSNKAMKRHYKYLFHQRAGEMLYPLSAGSGSPPLNETTNMMQLLTENPVGLHAAGRIGNKAVANLQLRQAFSTAAQRFEVIDAPTQGILVPYSRGVDLIAELSGMLGNSNYSLKDQISRLKEAQQYTVNVFPNVLRKLVEKNALNEIAPDSGMFALDARHYDDNLGITLDGKTELTTLIQ